MKKKSFTEIYYLPTHFHLPLQHWHHVKHHRRLSISIITQCKRVSF